MNTGKSVISVQSNEGSSENSSIATLPCRHSLHFHFFFYIKIHQILSTNPITDKKKHLNHEKNRDVVLLFPPPLNMYSHQQQVCSHRVCLTPPLNKTHFLRKDNNLQTHRPDKRNQWSTFYSLSGSICKLL